MPTMINPVLPNYGDTIPYQLRDIPRLVSYKAIPSHYGELRELRVTSKQKWKYAGEPKISGGVA